MKLRAQHFVILAAVAVAAAIGGPKLVGDAGASGCAPPPEKKPAKEVFEAGGEPARELAAELTMAKLATRPPVVTRVLGEDVQIELKAVSFDRFKLPHARITQNYRGVPVFGGEAVLHLSDEGKVRSVTDGFVKDVDVGVKPNLTEEKALSIAIEYAGGLESLSEEPEIDLMVLRYRPAPSSLAGNDTKGRTPMTGGKPSVDPNSKKPKAPKDAPKEKLPPKETDVETTPEKKRSADQLVYWVKMPQLELKIPRIMVVFVDALDGEVVRAYDALTGGKNRKTHDANNGTSLPGSIVRNEAAGPQGDAVLDAAHDNVGAVYDYFFNAHGRDSFNGNGATIKSTVHYSSSYVNAFWNGSQMVYGDGDGVQSDPLTTLDVVAHEFSHAVTDHSADLIYSDESGALNEATSDIFAAAIEAGVDGQISNDTWKIGEDCWTPGTAGDALRYMNDPQAAGDYDYYPTRYTGSSDNGGVHWNSGIANLFFYLLVEGGTHPRGTTNVNVSGIGMQDAASIWYRALTVYMTASTNFGEARAHTASACGDLFGGSAAQCAAVDDAWDAVGVGAPPSYTTVSTESNQSGASGSTTNYGPYDASGYDALRVIMTGGSGDADLYVRFGAAPTTSTYDCRPYLNGNNESCEFNPSQTGNYYVMVRAYTAYSGVTLTVDADTGGAAAGEICDDGVYNDGDGDNDCADSDCASDPACGPPAAEVCDDGVDNDGDGDTDCSDSDCANDLACTVASETSCTNGVDDDGDGDTDCADSDCASNPVCQAAEAVTLIDNDFESGWGEFNDGGSDARRSANDASYANSGTYCVRLRDNSGSASSAWTDTLDISGYNQLTVAFSFYIRSFESGEDFFVELHDGSQWVQIGQYKRKPGQYNNNTRYNETITVSSSNVIFASNAKLRFRADASGNSDFVYIDDVVVTAE